MPHFIPASKRTSKLALPNVSVEPFHLFRYLDEQVFRYNNRATKKRNVTDADRFDMAVRKIFGKRLTFAELTGKLCEHGSLLTRSA